MEFESGAGGGPVGWCLAFQRGAHGRAGAGKWSGGFTDSNGKREVRKPTMACRKQVHSGEHDLHPDFEAPCAGPSESLTPAPGDDRRGETHDPPRVRSRKLAAKMEVELASFPFSLHGLRN